MGRWVEISLEGGDVPPGPDHISDEDLARLADGAVDPGERRGMIRHLNGCPDCYAVLSGTLRDRAGDRSGLTRRRWLALAASVMLTVGLGAGVYRWIFGRPGGPTVAVVPLDGELRSLLMSAEAAVWAGERADRLAALLRERGVSVRVLSKVVMTRPYVAKKDLTAALFGPKESLRVEITGDTARIEVVRDEKK